MKRFIACLALLALPLLPAQGQTPTSGSTMDFKELLDGKTTPLALKLKDLNSDWRHISVGGMDNGLGFLGSLLGGNKGASYYTKGQSVLLGGETYIIAYKPEIKSFDLMSLIASSAAGGGKEPDMSKMMPEKMTPDTPLSLALLNLRTSGSLTDIRPFDMAQEIADSANSGGGLSDLLMMGMMANANKSAGSRSPDAMTAPSSPPKAHKATPRKKTNTNI